MKIIKIDENRMSMQLDGAPPHLYKAVEAVEHPVHGMCNGCAFQYESAAFCARVIGESTCIQGDRKDKKSIVWVEVPTQTTPSPAYQRERADALGPALLEVEEMLWQRQLEEWPDSRRLTFGEVYENWGFKGPGVIDNEVMRNIALCNQYAAGVWYECVLNGNGTRRWRGYRFGFEGHEYVSGFGRH